MAATAEHSFHDVGFGIAGRAHGALLHRPLARGSVRKVQRNDVGAGSSPRHLIYHRCHGHRKSKSLANAPH